MTDNLKEGILSGLRVAVLAIVSYGLTDGVIGLILSKVGVDMDQTTTVILTGLITSVLKGIDKLLHENELDKPEKKQNEGFMGVHGLTGF